MIQTFTGGGRDLDDYGWSSDDFSAIATATREMEQFCGSESNRFESVSITLRGWVDGVPIVATHPATEFEHLSGTTITCHRNMPSWPSGNSHLTLASTLVSPPTYAVTPSIAGDRAACITSFDPEVRTIALYSRLTSSTSSPWTGRLSGSEDYPDRSFRLEYEGEGDPFLGVCPLFPTRDPMFLVRASGILDGRPFETEIASSTCLRVP